MPPTTTLPEDAIGITEAAALLGLAQCSLWRRIRDGVLRGWRVGKGRWKLSRAEVLSLIHTNAPTPEALGRAELAERAAETDRVLRAEGVRR